MNLLLIILTILESLLGALSTRTLQADINMSVTEQASQPFAYNGNITMRGDCFKGQMMGYEMAYDGKTLYVYSEDLEELTLSTPTPQDLLEANPFLYAKALIETCDITEKSFADGKQTVITLTPKNRNTDIQRYTLIVENGVGKMPPVPLSVEIKEGKKNIMVRLNNPIYIDTTPRFAIEKENVYLNDLR